MRTYEGNIYFSLMEKHNFGRVIFCRKSNDIGGNIFDILGIRADEAEFLKNNLLSCSTLPIILLGKNRAVIVCREMFYSHGMCCFVSLERDVTSACKLFCDGETFECLCSHGVRARSASCIHQSGLCDIYIELARLTDALSAFGDNIKAENIYGVADKISYLTNCRIGFLNMGESSPVPMRAQSRVYSNSTLAVALAVTALCGTKSNDRCVYLRRLGENIEIRTKHRGTRHTEVFDHLKHISEARDMGFHIYTDKDEIILSLCPFYADIGLVGVKNYLKFDFWITKD